MTRAIFTGAGASRPFGVPLTNQLLPRIRGRLASGELFRDRWSSLNTTNGAPPPTGGPDESAANREAFSRGISVLLPGFQSAESEHLPLITDVLSLVDHSLRSVNALTPLMNTATLTKFSDLLEQAILEVLAQCEPGDEIDNATLTAFADGVFREREETGIISTNYDIELESQLFKRYHRSERESRMFIRDQNIDFGFDWRDPVTGVVNKRPVQASLRLYKIHGSLNWLRCELCDHVYVNTYASIVELAFQPTSSTNTCHCDYAPLRTAIIAPSIVRDVRNVSILECWKNALEFLRTASEWVIIGYSFPPEDIAIRSLFLRAYNARRMPPTIHVVQKGEDLLPRYRLFFPDCTYEAGGVEAFVRKYYAA